MPLRRGYYKTRRVKLSKGGKLGGENSTKDSKNPDMESVETY